MGFCFSHISLIRTGGCRTAFIATSLSKFLPSLWWLGACTECNTMKLQLSLQNDVAAGQYAQSFLGIADEKLQFTSPMTLSTSKHTLSYYNSAGELQRVFFSHKYVIISKATTPLRAKLPYRKSNVNGISLRIWG